MKKLYFFPLLLLTLVIGIGKVKADGSLYFSHFYDNYDKLILLETTYEFVYTSLVNYYNSNFSNDFSYYYIYYSSDNNSYCLSAFDSPNSFFAYDIQSGGGSPNFIQKTTGQSMPTSNYCYNIDNNSYNSFDDAGQVSFDKLIYSSNVGLSFVDSNNCGVSISSRCADIAQLPSYSNLELDVSYQQIDIEDGDIIPTYMSLTNGEPSSDFTEVDMSQYDYIILSLKNYNTTSFNTTIYSLGRLCFTPVYDYGMKQKNELINGYQTMGCTEYYNSLTPVSIYIIQADIDNNAVYYIKRYNNETNVLKIPTSIFNITYITSQDVNNPNVIINNRSYPAIPYSQLTDTANNSTEIGYLSGQVCALGDVNCEYKTGIGLDISDLFTQPLKVLQSVWSSITSIFVLIGQFISLIPSPLKEFLISAFMLSIILGIIKIIL